MSRALAAALCLAAVPALAFEGVIDTKMTAAGGEMGGKPMNVSGAGKISIKGLNTRMDQEMNMPGVSGPMKQTVIHRADEPDVTYILHDANKTYTKIVADKDEPSTDKSKEWSVKKIGKDTVAGRPTEHVQVFHEGEGPDGRLGRHRPGLGGRSGEGLRRGRSPSGRLVEGAEEGGRRRHPAQGGGQEREGWRHDLGGAVGEVAVGGRLGVQDPPGLHRGQVGRRHGQLADPGAAAADAPSR